MSTTGFFRDFSLAEVFQFIRQGHRSGLLTIRTLSDSRKIPSIYYITPSIYYIWIDRGYLVAAANRLDQEGLISLIEDCHLVSDRVLDKLVHWGCPLDVPLGWYLRSQGVLSSKQLEQLFDIQVVKLVRVLSQLQDAQFKFDPNVYIPMREMTGLCVLASLSNLYQVQRLFFQRNNTFILNFKYLRNVSAASLARSLL